MNAEVSNYQPTHLHVATAYDAAQSQLIGVFHTEAGARVAVETYMRNSSQYSNAEIAVCEVDRAYLSNGAPLSVKRYELSVQFFEVT